MQLRHPHIYEEAPQVPDQYYVVQIEQIEASLYSTKSILSQLTKKSGYEFFLTFIPFILHPQTSSFSCQTLNLLPKLTISLASPKSTVFVLAWSL